MAQFVLTNAHLTVNSVDLSNHVKTVTVNTSQNLLDNTTMSNTSMRRIGGLKDFNLSVEFAQDYAASSVDATLWGIYNAGVAVPVVLRSDAGVISATNPEFTGNVLLESYDPISGATGDHATTSVSFQGDGALSRATA